MNHTSARLPRLLTRRQSLTWAAGACLVGPAAWAQQPLRRVLVTDFEVLEDQPQADLAAALAQRAAASSRLLRQRLTEEKLYEVIDPAAAQTTLAALRERHAVLYECVGCAQALGQAAGAELVLMPWAQVVSQLIINLNVELREVTSDRVLLNKSVDLRGNNDVSWERGIRFMVRDWAQKRAANPNYGR
jgi:Protein of unknown function (DUF2380)